MKLCRFGDERYGLVRDTYVYDITEHVEHVVGIGTRLQRGDAVIAHLPALLERLRNVQLGAAVGHAGETPLLVPVAFPGKIVAAPVNYQAHIEESVRDPGITFNHAVATIGQAGLFLKATSALVGPSQGIAIRFPDRRTDHEMELGLIIGRECRDVPEEHALEYIAGYAIALDMTVRGTEDRSFRKSIDSYAVLGPWLVTADEVPNPNDVEFSLKVNGEVRQAANTRRLIYNVQKLISWASRWYTLYPGDILMTGTPEGVAPVAEGDVLDCTMQYIGDMRVRVRAAAPLKSGNHAAEAVPT
jgi:2-keto-4-pentenoate hydratase/2-oxohepta-3-ene-1,7-dioic acid hydratase in catechol pathway